jgi:hypothetical protein
MGEAKRRRDAMLKSDKWVYFPSTSQDLCCGKLTTIAKEIATRLSVKEISGYDIPSFINDSLINALNENKNVIWRETNNRHYNRIVNTCLQMQSFQFNEVYSEGELIDYEEIKYCPDMDTRYCSHWD